MEILWENKVLGVYNENKDCDIVVRHRGYVGCYYVDGPLKGKTGRFNLIRTGVGFLFPPIKQILVDDEIFVYVPSAARDGDGFGVDDYEPGGEISMYYSPGGC